MFIGLGEEMYTDGHNDAPCGSDLYGLRFYDCDNRLDADEGVNQHAIFVLV